MPPQRKRVRNVNVKQKPEVVTAGNMEDDMKKVFYLIIILLIVNNITFSRDGKPNLDKILLLSGVDSIYVKVQITSSDENFDYLAEKIKIDIQSKLKNYNIKVKEDDTSYIAFDQGILFISIGLIDVKTTDSISTGISVYSIVTTLAQVAILGRDYINEEMKTHFMITWSNNYCGWNNNDEIEIKLIDEVSEIINNKFIVDYLFASFLKLY